MCSSCMKPMTRVCLLPDLYFVVWPSCAHLDCTQNEHCSSQFQLFFKVQLLQRKTWKNKGDILGDLNKLWDRMRLCQAWQLCLCLYDILKISDKRPGKTLIYVTKTPLLCLSSGHWFCPLDGDKSLLSGEAHQHRGGVIKKATSNIKYHYISYWHKQYEGQLL